MDKIILQWNPYSTNNIYYRAWKHWFIKPLAKQLKENYIIQAKQQYKWGLLLWDLYLEIKMI